MTVNNYEIEEYKEKIAKKIKDYMRQAISLYESEDCSEPSIIKLEPEQSFVTFSFDGFDPIKKRSVQNHDSSTTMKTFNVHLPTEFCNKFLPNHKKLLKSKLYKKVKKLIVRELFELTGPIFHQGLKIVSSPKDYERIFDQSEIYVRRQL